MKTTKKRISSGFGQAVLESLRGWDRGEPITVRQVEAIAAPRAMSGPQLRQFRIRTLGVSQSVLAQLLGVSSKLVEAWEAGRNKPAGPVRRLIELIELDPKGFVKRYARKAA